MPDNENGTSMGRYKASVSRSGRDTSPGSLSDRYPGRCPTPSSVKAFAQARHHGREHSPSETPDAKRRGSQGGFALNVSLGSTRSCHSRHHTTDRDSASLETNRSAEEDVCDPVQREHRDGRLYIDFDRLETLVKSEKLEQPVTHACASLGPAYLVGNRIPMLTADGDLTSIPSWASMRSKKEVVPQGLTNAQKRAEPNRFSFFSSARESSIHAAEFDDLLLPGDDIRQLFCFPKGASGGVWWLHMNNPTGEEVRTICTAFGVHPLTIEDINTQESREKIELFRSYYFASFRSFTCVDQPDGIDFAPFSLYLVVFREGALTFSFAPESHTSRVRLRISQLKEHVSLSSDWICYALIDDIVDSFSPAIKQIEREADTIEDEVFITRPNDHQEFLRRMSRARMNLMDLMRLLGPKADVLRAFAKRCNEDYDVTPRMDIGLYLSDVQDHVVTMMNGLVQSDAILSRYHSIYLAQLSIDNIDQGNRTLEFLGRVSVIASILVPLTVVCGLFGMNIKVPWREDDNLNAWLGIMSGIVFFALFALLTARRMRYI